MWPSKYSFNWNAMDVGPKRDLVGKFHLVFHLYISTLLCIKVILLMLFVIELILHLVYIIRCLNGFIHCILRIKRMVSRHNYFHSYVVRVSDIEKYKFYL
jgi:hypothetical protein